MTIKGKILSRLYAQGRVTAAGLRKSVADGVITDVEYTAITGEAYE